MLKWHSQQFRGIPYPEENKDTSPEAQRQFTREATVLANLSHPNLPRVTDHFILPGQGQYLVMDYVEGDDLAGVLSQRGPLPVQQAVTWISQVADALIYLHSRQPPVVHRDIKPANIKITPEGKAMLVDFGLVKILASDEVTITILQGRGTALYTPLEQYGGDSGHTDVRSDIYAFGATLYHLLTNHSPVEARELFLSPSALTPSRQLNPNVSQRTERAIQWAMNLHPDERPQDVETFRRALLGDWDPVTRPRAPLPAPTLADLVASPIERMLIWIAGGLLLISLAVTLMR